jgi:hypothetical protein
VVLRAADALKEAVDRAWAVELVNSPDGSDIDAELEARGAD